MKQRIMLTQEAKERLSEWLLQNSAWLYEQAEELACEIFDSHLSHEKNHYELGKHESATGRPEVFDFTEEDFEHEETEENED